MPRRFYLEDQTVEILELLGRWFVAASLFLTIQKAPQGAHLFILVAGA